jgi:asparaginyl-tRNA synthetase
MDQRMTSVRTFKTELSESDHDTLVDMVGWVDALRKQTKVSFLQLRFKGTSPSVQVVVSSDKLHADICVESFVRVRGVVRKLPLKARSSYPIEIHAEEVEVVGSSTPEFRSECPPQSHADTKLQKRHLWMRDPLFATITRLRAVLIKSIRKYFEDSGCLDIIPPSFTSVECEGGASLFRVTHPGKTSDKPMDVYLTQSSQFALEYAVPAQRQHCYCIAPSFRAESSHTRRHLTEFMHAEAEWMGIFTMDDHLDKLKALMTGILANLQALGSAELEELGITARVAELLEMSQHVLVLDHKDAIAECRARKIYKDEETKLHFEERDDIPEMQERKLIDSLGCIVMLVRFPKEFKSFYMALDPEDQTRVLGCDVEVPGVGEVIGSGIREWDEERLRSRLLESKLDPEDYREYLDLRKYGHGRTSGMGLGIDRMLTWIIGVTSIREVVTFPRFPGYARP